MAESSSPLQTHFSEDLKETFNVGSPERHVESYIPLKILGRGAFGEAVLYRRTDDDSLVVWKEVNLGRASDDERSNSLNEVDILSLLDHVNIIAYYNHFIDENTSALCIEMEYANGGSLHHKIGSRSELFDEPEVLWYFYQLVSAVAYIHENGILHRDIKALNIFLTKAGLLKLGDFGISKVLEETAAMAESQVGTPYYMSPELIRGDRYDQKSDIWAVGCVLYELLMLEKVFDATNQLKLAHVILEDDYRNIHSKYSSEMHSLVAHLLNKDPKHRAFASEVLKNPILADVQVKFKKHCMKDKDLSGFRRTASSSSSSSLSTPVVSSVTSEIFWWGGGKMLPQKLEMFTKDNAGLHVSAGHNHLAVVTVEKDLYTWANIQGGASIVGQLGHGDTAMYRTPKKVEFFFGVAVKQVACGEDFTAILTDNGQLFMTGSDYYGCIGCDGTAGDTVTLPNIVDALADVPILSVSCGNNHVAVLTQDRLVYTWGCGEHGRLGHGNEDDVAVPNLVPMPRKYSSLLSVSCGLDNTFFLTKNGSMLVCGSNEDNKMAINQTRFVKGRKPVHSIIHFVLSPMLVRALKAYRIIKISSGKNHSAAIDITGRLVTFGNNKYGQLGVGDNKPKNSPCIVRGCLSGKEVSRVACGNCFTVAATLDNHVYSWGVKDNGRLGLDPNVIGDKTYCSIPRPIFGSLHKVADMDCNHWHAIILAERVLSSRVIQKRSSTLTDTSTSTAETSFKLKSMGFSDDGITSNVETDRYSDGMNASENSAVFSPTASLDESGDTPLWLRNELEDAEYIPFPGSKGESSKETSGIISDWATSTRGSMEDKGIQCSLQSSCDGAEITLKYLRMRIEKLEMVNADLLKSNKEYEAMIKALKRENEVYSESSKKFLSLGGTAYV